MNRKVCCGRENARKERVTPGEPGWDVIACRQMAAELVRMAKWMQQEVDR